MTDTLLAVALVALMAWLTTATDGQIGPDGTPRGWLAMWRVYSRDVLAQDLYTLPWVRSRREALQRAAMMRESARQDLALWILTNELHALGLYDGATALQHDFFCGRP